MQPRPGRTLLRLQRTQTFANDVLIAQGAQPEELFMLSLEQLEQQTLFIPDVDADEIATDLVIVGGGPAGLAAGIYAVRSGLKTVVIERGPAWRSDRHNPHRRELPGLHPSAGKGSGGHCSESRT